MARESGLSETRPGPFRDVTFTLEMCYSRGRSTDYNAKHYTGLQLPREKRKRWFDSSVLSNDQKNILFSSELFLDLVGKMLGGVLKHCTETLTTLIPHNVL